MVTPLKFTTPEKLTMARSLSPHGVRIYMLLSTLKGTIIEQRGISYKRRFYEG